MKKINNKGWGYFPFLMILLLLLGVLLLVTLMVNEFDRKFPNDDYRIMLTTKKNNLIK